jgi:hypothetical protein
MSQSECEVLPVKLILNGSGSRTRTLKVGTKILRYTNLTNPEQEVVGDPGNDPGQHIGLGFTDPLASLAK